MRRRSFAAHHFERADHFFAVRHLDQTLYRAGDGARKSAAPVAIAFCGVALKPASQGSCVLDEKRQCRPDVADDIRTRFSDSVVGQPDGMICFLHLERMFGREDKLTARAA
ncbi:hypothetical protein [Rhizobium sp. BK176]|uniref:hypothetical protein n=1 Tax=Rhizobium sp. BK176 TaxID=2587071 RepID=UPI0021687A0A|nr:hypothetical protein [Rhizobium sp. BK176]MCS4094044.1 hypothetical protein [Rhizobium sp. BK176]